MSTFSSKENKTGFDQVNFKWRDPELLILPEMSALSLLALQIGCVEEMVFSRQEGADAMELQYGQCLAFVNLTLTESISQSLLL